MSNGNNYTAAQAIEAIQGSRGFITAIAKRMGCARKTVYNLIDKYPTVKGAVEDEREQLKDFAESKLFKLIDNEVPSAIFFYLKCQAKERGYVERQEISGPDGKSIPIEIREVIVEIPNAPVED